jgi:hypothetical protein
MLLQELDYIATAEQTNDTIAPFDPLLTDWQKLVSLCQSGCNIA